MKSPLVIGYKGEIGSFILNGLLRLMPKANDIWCVDINNSAVEVVERIKKSDVIFLCVPIRDTVKWLEAHSLFLKDKIIIEQASLKESIFKSQVVKDFNVIPMHILFRPSATPNCDDRKVALFDSPPMSSKMVEVIKKLTLARIVWFQSVSEHDQEMAIQQALVHRTLLALNDLTSINNTTTYIGGKVAELCERISNGDEELYEFIQSNEHLTGKIDLLVEGIKNFDIKEHMIPKGK